MLDRKFILENVEEVRKNCIDRNMPVDIDRFVELENQRKALQTEAESLNRQANEVSKSIGRAANPEEREVRKEEGKKLREQVAAVTKQLDELSVELDAIHRSIPNMHHPDIPIGKDDKANLECGRGVTPLPQFDFQPLDHVELGQKLDLIDFEGGARVAGTGFYFLKNEAALMEVALQMYVMQFLKKEGFTPITTRGEPSKSLRTSIFSKPAALKSSAVASELYSPVSQRKNPPDLSLSNDCDTSGRIIERPSP